jgi:hypothetical protein
MVAVETDCMAGVRGLELRNVVANYPFERSRRFPGLKPNSGHGDYSRFELRRYGYAAKSQWLEFKARALACYQAASPALARICGTTRLMPLPCRRTGVLAGRLRSVHYASPLPTRASAGDPHHQSARAAIRRGAATHQGHPPRIRRARHAQTNVRCL